MIAAAVDPVNDNRFSMVLHTGEPWENGCDIEISSVGECACIVHPDLAPLRVSSTKFRFDLDPVRLEKLIAVIRRVGFFDLKELYSDENMRGCRKCYVKVELEGQSHVVNTRTHSPVAAIQNIIEALNELLPQNCPRIH